MIGSFKVGDVTTNYAGESVEIIHDLHSGTHPLIGVVDRDMSSQYTYEGRNEDNLDELALVPIAAEFNVGDSIMVGTTEHTPGSDHKPWPGRVICNDAINVHGMTVLSLVRKYGQANEVLMQHAADGASLLEVSHGTIKPAYRLYHA